jgi:hypothetical protein
MLKTLALILAMAACGSPLRAQEQRTLAESDWSERIESHDRFLRARVLVVEGRSRAYAGPGAEVMVYIELENTNAAWGKPLEVYFDPSTGLKFEVLDADGKPIPPSPMAGSGGDVGACWVTIPYDSSTRLRANPGWARTEHDQLVLPLRPLQGQFWRLPADGEYYLQGSLKIAPPSEDSIEHYEQWRGELKFPKTKIAARKS